MAREKPGLPKGTRDFGPDVMNKRNFILNTITKVFRKYGFRQIETPSLENLSVLMGKYGEEGDQLLFKVLNSGDYLKDVTDEDIKKGYKYLLPKIANKGLRYDLTVPLARFVVMNRNEISFPFKRYQIQPVWRADKPQRGRYREFLQCDADIIGTSSLLCEMEIVQMMAEVMSELGIAGFKIRMNHRKILGSMAKSDGLQNQENLFAVIIDKMDKIGWDGVSKELLKIGFTPDSLSKFKQIFSGELDKEDLRKKLSPMLDRDGANGLDDIFTVFEMLKKSRGNPDEQDFKWHLQFDPSLARGLSYYTGIIFEVEIEGVTVGSVSGGGRYDDLTGIFGLPDVAATGFSFGIDRLYDALEELKVFPDFAIEGHNILIVHFDEETFNYGLEVLWRLRKNQKLNTRGVSIEMYPDQSRLTKQMAYANRNPIRFTIIIGSEEMKSGKLTLKDMITGDQQSLSEDEIIDYLSQKRV